VAEQQKKGGANAAAPKPDRRVEELARLLFVRRSAAETAIALDHVAARCIADAAEFYRVWDKAEG
jgi:hypothetical protein